MDYSKEISKLIVELSEKIGKPLTSDDFYIQYQSLGHKPMPLPKDKIAVYTFVYMGQFFKDRLIPKVKQDIKVITTI